MANYTIDMVDNEYPAQYLRNSPAVDYNPALGGLLVKGKFDEKISTTAVFQMANGADLSIFGSGLTYSNGVLDGGTITSVVVSVSGGPNMQEIDGLHWSGIAFHKAFLAGLGWAMSSSILRGNDNIAGSIGNDELWGLNGNDTLVGGNGSDDLEGGRGTDTYDGGTSGNDIDQLNFDDRVAPGGVVVDMFKGTDVDPWGNVESFTNIERIKGTRFVDVITGSNRNDQFRPMAGNDQVDGGSGTDTVRYDRDYLDGGNAGVTVDLGAGYGIDGSGDRDTLKRIENVVGSPAADTLKGDGGSNLIAGLVGKDELYGKGGADRFVYGSETDSTVDPSGRDTIHDFNSKDRIDLSVMDADDKKQGDQAFSFLGTHDFDGTAGELRYEKHGSQTLLFGDTNGDKHADFSIELVGAIDMQKDFLLL